MDEITDEVRLRPGIDGPARRVKGPFNLDPYGKNVLFLFCGRMSGRRKGNFKAEARRITQERFERLRPHSGGKHPGSKAEKAVLKKDFVKTENFRDSKTI